MTAKDLKPGMQFSFGEARFKLVALAQACFADGKRIPIDNRLRNKWIVETINPEKPFTSDYGENRNIMCLFGIGHEAQDLGRFKFECEVTSELVPST